MQTLTPDSFCPLTDPQPYQRERDKPRQGVVANTLKLYRNGAVGFIDWLGPGLLEPYLSVVLGADIQRLMDNAINDDDFVGGFTVRVFGHQI